MNELKVKVGGDISGFEVSMQRVRMEARRMGNSVTSGIGNRIAGMFAIGAVENAIRKTAEYAGQLTDLSARTGVSVESLQRLDRAAKENGTSLDALVGLWERVGAAREDALKNPSGGDAKAFGALGVGQGLLKAGSPDDIVRKIAEQFQNSTNIDQLVAPLREIGGRGAGQMIALFRAGLDQQYQDMQVMSAAQADILDELDDKWSTLSQTISVGLAPWLVKLIDGFRYLQDSWEQIFQGIFSVISMFDDYKIGSDKGFFDGMAQIGSDAWGAFKKGVKAASGEIDDRNENEARQRQERIKRRLEFGKSDFSGVEEKNTKRQRIERQMDDLSKAGLFAGGAGNIGGTNSIEQQQLNEQRNTTNAVRDVAKQIEEKL